MSSALARRTTTALAVNLEELRQEAKRLVEPPHARETRRRYAREVRSFREFCEAIGAEPLPSSPETVVLYLTHLKRQGRTAGGIDSALTAISTWHSACGHDSPRGSLAVKVARENIRREIGVRPRKKAPLRVDPLRAAVEAVDTSSLLGKRDRALLLVGFAGAFRRSELAGLDAGDVTFCAEGALLHVRRSKTDQQGRGKVKAIPHDAPGDPISALRAWLDASGRTAGPLFVHVDRWGNQSEGRLDGGSIARVVKRRLRDAGIDPAEFSGHSMRRGLISEAADAGKARHKIQAQSFHTSGAMLDEYIDKSRLFDDNAASGLGWQAGDNDGG